MMRRLGELRLRIYFEATFVSTAAAVMFCAAASFLEVFVGLPRPAPTSTLAVLAGGFCVGWILARHCYR